MLLSSVRSLSVVKPVGRMTMAVCSKPAGVARSCCQAYFGVQFIDADAMACQSARYLSNDAWVVRAGQIELHSSTVRPRAALSRRTVTAIPCSARAANDFSKLATVRSDTSTRRIPANSPLRRAIELSIQLPECSAMTCAKVCTNPVDLRNDRQHHFDGHNQLLLQLANLNFDTQSLHGFGHVQHRPDGASIVAKSGHCLHAA